MRIERSMSDRGRELRLQEKAECEAEIGGGKGGARRCGGWGGEGGREDIGACVSALIYAARERIDASGGGGDEETWRVTG